MTDTAAPAKPPAAERLLRGAKVLGTLWMKNIRCPMAWQYSVCTCEPKTEFCKARALWMELLTSEIVAMNRDAGLVGDADIDGGAVRLDEPSTDFDLIMQMTAAEFEASGLTLVLEFPEIGTVKVGPKGSIPWKAFVLKTKNANDLKIVMKVLRDFPGAKVVE